MRSARTTSIAPWTFFSRTGKDCGSTRLKVAGSMGSKTPVTRSAATPSSWISSYGSR